MKSVKKKKVLKLNLKLLDGFKFYFYVLNFR